VETAPSADGSWFVATRREGAARIAIVPPGVRAFVESQDTPSAWWLAVWHADRDADLRGIPPTEIRALELADVLALRASGLRTWARAEHRRALLRARAAVGRAQAGTAACRNAEMLLAELTRQDADVRAVRTVAED
jgi:hypothetical protein